MADFFEKGGALLLFQAFFQGVMLMRILNVLGDWRIFKTREYIYYAGYLVCLNVFCLIENHHFLSLWMGEGLAAYSVQQDTAINCFKSLMYLSVLLYCRFYRAILNIDTKSPHLIPLFEKIEKWMLIPFLLIDISLSIFGLYGVSLILCVVANIIFSLAGIYVLNQTTKKGDLLSLLVSIASWAFLIGAAITILNISFILFIYKTDAFHYPMLFTQIGTLIEVLIFNLALNYKAQLNYRERLQTQEEKQQLLERYIETESERVSEKDFHTEIIHSIIKGQVRSIKDKIEEVQVNRAQEELQHTLILVEELEMSCDFGEHFSDKKIDNLHTLLISICENLPLRLEKIGSEQQAFTFTIHVDTQTVLLDTTQKFAVIFFIYEAITNIIKHAKYKYVELKASIEPSGEDGRKVCITLTDDGIGLPTTLALDNRVVTIENGGKLDALIVHGRHIFGLKKLFEKAKQLNGILTINSSKETGTQLILYFPMNS